MMGKRTLRRVSLALSLAGFLLMDLGCQPTNSSTPGPSTNKPVDQKPDTKSSGQPKPDPG
ncbi:MAG TPA: hypothetical protein VH592_06560 [Gemmataceae bacterium]|jgi:hypothetical protein